MDAHVDAHLTQGDTSQKTLAEGNTVVNEHEDGDTEPNEDTLWDNLEVSPNVHPDPGADVSHAEANEGQSPIHSFKSEQEPSEIQMERARIDHEHSCTDLQSHSDEVVLPTISEELHLSELADVSPGEFTSSKNSNESDIDDSEAHTIAYPQEPPFLRARTVSSGAAPREEKEADSDDGLNYIQMLHTGMDDVDGSGPAPLPDEEETREELGYTCEDLPSSLPPSSSPPQLFSSSPCASSQSSVKSVEPSKMVLSVDAEDCGSTQDCPHGDHVVFVAQDGSCLESENLRSHDTCDVATPQETERDCSQMSLSFIEGDPGPSRKRVASQSDPDESYEAQPLKRPKLDSCLYLPPGPRRATLASQHRQLKKLAAPFRPPLKLPIITDGPAQIMNNKEAETTISTTPETSHEKINLKEPTTHLFFAQHKSSNTSRSVTQFKSPLVNRVLPADGRTIRLTPELQALERKLQLLKRAIKVKEDKEEQILTRLAKKWVEAGREVACDVWDATKDAGDFVGKATSVRRSYGWESTSDGSVPWGWDTKPNETGEGSCELDPSVAPYTARRPAPEEDDDDVGYHTLGTMLRQLGIAPEIFGWDDDKESFTD